MLQAFDFDTDENIDYKFSDLIETTRIELTEQKDTAASEQLVQPKLDLKFVLYYSGHILAAHKRSSQVEVYKVNGPLSQTLDLQQVVSNFNLTEVDYIMIPKLDW